MIIPDGITLERKTDLRKGNYISIEDELKGYFKSIRIIWLELNFESNVRNISLFAT